MSFVSVPLGGWRILSHALDRKLQLGAAHFDRAERKGAVLDFSFFDDLGLIG
jgi:hypothetical protein